MSLTSLWDAHVDEEARKEAEQAAGGKILPPGTYTLTADKVEEKENPLDFRYQPGAQFLHLWVVAANAEAKGRIFVDVTPITYRRGDGKLEAMSKLWHQYAKALGVSGKPATDIRDAILAYPVAARISAGFKKADGTTVFANSAEDFAQYVADGLEGRNYVQSVFAVKG